MIQTGLVSGLYLLDGANDCNFPCDKTTDWVLCPPPTSKSMLRFIGDSELPIGVNGVTWSRDDPDVHLFAAG